LKKPVTMQPMRGALAYLFLVGVPSLLSPLAGATQFVWPEARRAAVSITFDDGRNSQLDVGLPILNRYDVKATFYVMPKSAERRSSDWRDAIAAGHEIGNHTMCHPSSGNFRWAKTNALEQYSLGRMGDELDTANLAIEAALGVTPVTFAYPCGQKWVGRGEGVKSYVPLVAQRFLAGRGWLDECANNPESCDLAQVTGMKLDGLRFDEIKALLDGAIEAGSWLVLVGHDVGADGPWTTRAETLMAFCEYASVHRDELWVGTVADVASWISSQRGSGWRGRSTGWKTPVKLSILYVGATLSTGVMCFLGVFMLQKRTPRIVWLLVVLSGTVILLLGAIWSARHGYVGPRGLLPLFVVLGYCLGTSSGMLWHGLVASMRRGGPSDCRCP